MRASRGVRDFAALGAALATVLAAGCRAAPPLPDTDVVARLGGEDVRFATFDRYLRANVGESGGGLESEALSGLFDQFVTERLLARLAADRHLVHPETPPGRAVEALLAAEPAPPITESAVAGYYAAHADDFRVPERVELFGIRCEDRFAAEGARRELARGADFAEVARRLSSGPTAEAGGALGRLSRDELPAELAATIFALTPNQPSPIVATGDGFEIFEITRRIPEHVRPLVEVRDEIQRRLGGARADRAYARLVEEARSRYAVQVFDRNLPFVYRGAFPVSRPYENP